MKILSSQGKEGAPFISIVIPVHNEAENVRQLAEELKAVLSTTTYESEVIFVDDVSIDNTAEVLNQLKDANSFVKVILLEERGGQTGCYQAAFQEARGKYIIRMDGDLQDDPKDLVNFFDLIGEEPDIIMGLRQIRRHHRILRLATMIYDMLILILFNSPFNTNSSSFIAFKAKFVQGIKLRSNDHRYLPLIAMHRGASNLKEVIVNNRNRIHGRTKYGYYTKFILGIPEVLRFLLRLRFGYYHKLDDFSGDIN